MMKTSLVGLAAVMMMGCTSATADSNDDAIIGGQETSDYTSVVGLRIKIGDKAGLCSATVVSPTVVLTAAHCIDVEGADGWEVRLGPNVLDAGNPSKLAVKEVHFDPQFDLNNVTNGHDIAVVILAEPTTLKPVKINRTSIDTLKGSKARLVGYGLNDRNNKTGAGIKRTAEVPVAEVDGKFVQTGSLFGTTMCNGDSGGPVLAQIDGETQIIGVNSYGMSLPNGPVCIATGYSTRVDTYLDFVDQYVR